MEQHVPGAKSKLSRTEDFIARWCDLLELPRRIMRAATGLATALKDKNGVYGRSYDSIAAAAIFVIAQLGDDRHIKSREQVGKVAKVSPETIRKTYRAMYPYIADAIPDELRSELRLSSLPSPYWRSSSTFLSTAIARTTVELEVDP